MFRGGSQQNFQVGESTDIVKHELIDFHYGALVGSVDLKTLARIMSFPAKINPLPFRYSAFGRFAMTIYKKIDAVYARENERR